MEIDLVNLIKNKTIPNLLRFEDPGLSYFTKRDLLGEETGGPKILWDHPEVIKGS